MKLGDLVDSVIMELPHEYPNRDMADAEIIKRLNFAQEEIGVDLGIPKRYTSIETTSNEFRLPVGANEGGLISIEYEDGGVYTSMTMMTVEEANRTRVGWKDMGEIYSSCPFAVYDPLNVTAHLYIVGTDSRNFRIHYIAKPLPMEDLLNHEPWQVLDKLGNRLKGELQEYHKILYYYVAYQMLSKAGTDRAAQFYGKYKSLLPEAYNYTEPKYYLRKNNGFYLDVK